MSGDWREGTFAAGKPVADDGGTSGADLSDTPLQAAAGAAELSQITDPVSNQSKVIFGTCGWIDQLYPPSTKDKLHYFSRRWPSVEVNASTYTIFDPSITAAWTKSVPPGFIFHFKAFGLFCSRGSNFSSLPGPIKALLPSSHHYTPTTFVPYSELPPAAVDLAWSLFSSSLAPVYKSEKLGIVTFQFHLSFHPSEANLKWVVECRRRLDPRFRMAAEFRCRRWFTEATWRERTGAVLRSQGVAWVAADELEHETFQQKDTGGQQQKRVVLPIAMEATVSDFFYVRIHRRTGVQERQLREEEIRAWVERIERLTRGGGAEQQQQQQQQPRFQGEIYFLWGTDHKEIPVRNADALRAALPERLRFEWKPKAAPGSIAALYSAAAANKKITGMKVSNDDDVGGGGGGGGQERPVLNSTPSRGGSKKSKSKNIGIKRFFSQRE